MHFLLPYFCYILLWKIVVAFRKHAAPDESRFSTIFRSLIIHVALACCGPARGYQKHAALFSRHMPVDALQIPVNKGA
jgi:hypothetical protein